MISERIASEFESESSYRQSFLFHQDFGFLQSNIYSKALDLIMAYRKCNLFDLLHKRLYSYRIYLQKNNEAKSNCWI